MAEAREIECPYCGRPAVIDVGLQAPFLDYYYFHFKCRPCSKSVAGHSSAGDLDDFVERSCAFLEKCARAEISKAMAEVVAGDCILQLSDHLRGDIDRFYRSSLGFNYV